MHNRIHSAPLVVMFATTAKAVPSLIIEASTILQEVLAQNPDGALVTPIPISDVLTYLHDGRVAFSPPFLRAAQAYKFHPPVRAAIEQWLKRYGYLPDAREKVQLAVHHEVVPASIMDMFTLPLEETFEKGILFRHYNAQNPGCPYSDNVFFNFVEEGPVGTVRFMVEECGADIHATEMYWGDADDQDEIYDVLDTAVHAQRLDMVKYIVSVDPKVLTNKGSWFIAKVFEPTVYRGARDEHAMSDLQTWLFEEYKARGMWTEHKMNFAVRARSLPLLIRLVNECGYGPTSKCSLWHALDGEHSQEVVDIVRYLLERTDPATFQDAAGEFGDGRFPTFGQALLEKVIRIHSTYSVEVACVLFGYVAEHCPTFLKKMNDVCRTTHPCV